MRDDRHALDYEPVRPMASRASAVKTRDGAARDEPRPAAPREAGRVNLSAEAEPETKSAPAAVLPANNAPAARALRPLKRGHAISFAGLFLFTVVLYFRPYEYLPLPPTLAFWFAVLTMAVYFPTQFAVEGSLTARPREVNLILIFVALALLSMPLAISPGIAWEEFDRHFIKAVLMFIVMVNVVRTERRLLLMIWLAVLIGCVLSVGAVGDYRSGRLVIGGDRVGGIVGGLFGNPNDMALHLVTVLPLAVALTFARRNPLAKLFYLVCAGLLVAGIVTSFSRGGFLGLVGVAVVLAWKFGRKYRLAASLMLVLAGGAFVVLAPGEYAGRLGSITDAGSDVTGSSGQRRELLIRSIWVSLRHPVLGVGMGNFHIVGQRELPTHNAYTQVSSEMGMAALVVYVLFMVVPLKKLRQIERETKDSGREGRYYYCLAVGVQAALVGYMVSTLFGSVAYQFYVYYLVGYAVCLRQLYESKLGVLDEVKAGTIEAARAVAPSEKYA